MHTFSTLLGFILTLSLLTFIVLFGRLPALRKTPIGYLHRFLVKSLPNGLYALDSRLLDGHVKVRLEKASNYLMKDNHPLVFIFFIVLMVGAELAFLPAAWSEMCMRDRIGGCAAILLPYIFLYSCMVKQSAITPENHAREMRRYPYDRIIFHPNQICGTCKFLKPARSRHCALCNVCVSRHDHHCIWLMRCVGRNNYRYFLGLLLSLGFIAIYAVFVGYTILSGRLQLRRDLARPSAEILPSPWYSEGDIMRSIHIFSAAIGDDPRLGAIFLLALMCSPLPFGLLVYHTYLIWAGTTTSETAKWDIWKELIRSRIAYKAHKSQVYMRMPDCEPAVDWPVISDQTLRCTNEGRHPRFGYTYNDIRYEIVQPNDLNAPEDGRWRKVRSMAEVVNMYDMGFKKNLRDAMALDIH
ncbi:palmitoyltransferase swf1 [Ascosphaera aggregata]|nr:palmitoyltransferase swf1 [Ascosphaera aggregata]